MYRRLKWNIGLIICLLTRLGHSGVTQDRARNPVIFSDVPDMSIVRVGSTPTI